MAPPNEQSLSQGIQAELQAKKQRLALLEQEEVQALSYMQELQAQARVIQQLNTSAREVQAARAVQTSGKTVAQQVQDQMTEVARIQAEVEVVRSTIELLSSP
ncbi:hypothetical protein BDDG_09546 [Blastomyces dermatitidis ATCC 18188]|uniref:Uncharacterized protein n=1 Tax=Ajellomyces dermatitidis (strain ATCC 18188 / CBS 674.68) TaxID=653446 RepID=F2TTN7_AJEDA|nr:hypothetical protein BDDG_09546 [Blastomyces dermatitidis ATCC 18188]EQL28893.1 hypothetical protein BDFG_08414 [Blastomyces dermatitidis ATCC 26199]